MFKALDEGHYLLQPLALRPHTTGMSRQQPMI
jgi:hypothetical protein